VYQFFGHFPQVRQRRLRQKPWIRDMVQENFLTAKDLILPIFIRSDNENPTIKTMPDVFRYSLKEIDKIMEKVVDLGIPAVMLFPYLSSSLKNDMASEALNPENLMCKFIKYIKQNYKNVGVIADVALDPYTSHGHDGILSDGDVDNDLTVEILCKQALNQARAGCDVIAPSDMMDGRIKMIRKTLDENNFSNVLILSYAAKFASVFYQPFRDAINTKLKGNKKTYQLNPANQKEALNKIGFDLNEGADMLIVKPAMSYLDIISKACEFTNVPIVAYQVSGEYAMIKWAALNQALDANMAFYESILSCKRAGARAVISYASLEIAEYLK
jgi:porphobilinogen synthase